VPGWAFPFAEQFLERRNAQVAFQQTMPECRAEGLDITVFDPAFVDSVTDIRVEVDCCIGQYYDIDEIQVVQSMPTTAQKLSEITDEGLFERLANGILRQDRPEYAPLHSTGVNVEGRTVRAPLDGICFVPGVDPPHMIAVHHATCQREALRKKWLNNPPVRESAAPLGDLFKTSKIVSEERKRRQSLRVTVVLTTNKELPEDLVRDVDAEAAKLDVGLDLWSVSRLADALDNTPSGQWLRHQYLGIEQEILSEELLATLSNKSLDIGQPPDAPEVWVRRDLESIISKALAASNACFVVGESGQGKSVACFKRLHDYIRHGGYGLILSDRAIASALTVENAIEFALHELHPQLTSRAADDALSFCSSDQPLLLVVEDISRSGQPALLADKLAKWASTQGPTKDSDGESIRARWRLLCPIWPQTLALLGDLMRKQVQDLAITCSGFLVPEGREAVQRRSKANGVQLSDLDAEGIAESLGHDPLLIALRKPEKASGPGGVIEEFIRDNIDRLAVKLGEYTSADYRTALRSVSRMMLFHRELHPSWSRLLGWVGDDPNISTPLRHLVHDRTIIRLAGCTNEILVFRHDRVRDALFSDLIADLIRADALENSLLAEPYFAEIIAAAILREDIPVSFVDRVRNDNPLVLFHALRLFGEPSRPIHDRVLKAIDLWLAEDNTHGSQNLNLRLEALAALSRTDSSKVVRIVREFKEKVWASWQALFRNGDVSGGILLCVNVPPGVTAIWRDQQIEHAKLRFGSRLTTSIERLLRQPHIARESRMGALRLAGYLPERQMAEAIEESWKLDTEKVLHLKDYLWAAAQCCGNDPERFLGPVCDAWAALSNERIDSGLSPREALASDTVKWAFQKAVPTFAIGYFIRRGNADDLWGPMTDMLSGIDHPDAVEFLARQLANIERQSKGVPSPFSIMTVQNWRHSQEDKGLVMSNESKQKLEKLWQDQVNDSYLRKQAFNLWSSAESGSDLEILHSFAAPDFLADLILFERLRRKDKEAISELIQKLNGEPIERAKWWPLARQVWCGQLRAALDSELAARRSAVAQGWSAGYATDYAVHELLMSCVAKEVEILLVDHWDHLRFSNLFVQVALYFATPRLLNLAAEAVDSCPTPECLFEHIMINYGIHRKGWSGITRREQIEALVPYFDLLDDHEIMILWEECNAHGWMNVRKELLDGRIRNTSLSQFIDENKFEAALDEFVQDGQSHWAGPHIDRCVNTGISPNHLIKSIGSWLATRKTYTALQFTAGALSQIGHRADLQILLPDIEPRVDAEALCIDTTFQVKRRTLS
jgi:hypothetical protein